MGRSMPREDLQAVKSLIYFIIMSSNPVQAAARDDAPEVD